MVVIWSVLLLLALAGVFVLVVAVSRQQRRDAAAAGHKMDEVMLSVLHGKSQKKDQRDV